MPQLHQSMYLLLFSIAFYLKHELTKAALRNHLKIRNIATNNSYKKLASPYTLLTNYKLLKSEFKIECVCREKTCKELLECGEDGFPKVAQNCDHKNIQSSSNSCFVLHLPIEQQVRYFLQHHGLPEIMREVDPTIRSDINSGNYTGIFWRNYWLPYYIAANQCGWCQLLFKK